MTTYPIPESLADTYRGAGWAVAAVLNGQVVALRYIEDTAPAIAEQLYGECDVFFIRQWLDTAEASQVVRELQVLGKVSVGMCSCWEFIEQ